MTKIKICGLTSFDDIKHVNLCLPDYVGFVFADSKRKVSVEYAKELIEGLDNRIKSVGVFVNEQAKNVAHAAQYCGLDAVQLHSGEDENYIAMLKSITSCEIWQAIRVNGKYSLAKASPLAHKHLFDTYHKDIMGGTGISFDWNLLKHADKSKLILAGGINENNVIEAIKTLNPYMVDVSSGVETDGKKDCEKIKRLIERVRGECL